jgi:hypothetical protein
VNASYTGGAGGGGGGGSVKARATGKLTLGQGATLSVRGGQGGAYAGTYTYYMGGQGGAGGDGYVRLEAAEDENNPGQPTIDGIPNSIIQGSPVSKGVFAPRGAGVPSVGQTVWMNLGVFDPKMARPAKDDVVATLLNDTMVIEVQMAREDGVELGQPDLAALDITDSDGDGEYDDSLNTATLSEWTRVTDIESLNGNEYQFIRVRVSFQLDPNHTASDPLPYLEYLRLPFKF